MNGWCLRCRKLDRLNRFRVVKSGLEGEDPGLVVVDSVRSEYSRV